MTTEAEGEKVTKQLRERVARRLPIDGLALADHIDRLTRQLAEARAEMRTMRFAWKEAECEAADFRQKWERAVIDLGRLRSAEARASTVEECARLVELIAADWRAIGADQKVWASEYLASEIRALSQTAALGTTK